MKRRKNADNALRAAERKANETGAPSDIAAYWRLLLKSGRIPNASKVDKYTINDEPVSIWTLHLNESLEADRLGKPWYMYPPHVTRHTAIDGRELVWLVRNGVETRFDTLKEALEALVESHGVNPRRRARNADDNIRKLERAATSGNYEDISRYWRALLKAGQMPKPFWDYESLEARDGSSYRMPWVAWAIIDENGDRPWQVNIEMRPHVGPTDYTVRLFDSVSHNHSRGYDREVTFTNRQSAWQLAAQWVLEMLEKYDDPKMRGRGWL